ncbi:MAG: response regulator [Planctomycetes bacterium]|nr:response regulator [Planctomycetota bacterium]
MVDKIAKESLGLMAAWLDDELDTVAKAVSYLEDRNFVIYVTDDIDEFEGWICQNGYDVALTDLYMPRRERQGDDVIRELIGAGLSKPIVAVSAYLKEFIDPLEQLSELVTVPIVDKDAFSRPSGLEEFRRLLINQAGGGKIRVVERVIGYVKEEVGSNVVVSIKLPSGDREDVLFQKETLMMLGTGRQKKYLEIETVERIHGNRLLQETLLKWVSGPTSLRQWED